VAQPDGLSWPGGNWGRLSEVAARRRSHQMVFMKRSIIVLQIATCSSRPDPNRAL
jgi:hypothetical protein